MRLEVFLYTLDDEVSLIQAQIHRSAHRNHHSNATASVNSDHMLKMHCSRSNSRTRSRREGWIERDPMTVVWERLECGEYCCLHKRADSCCDATPPGVATVPRRLSGHRYIRPRYRTRHPTH